MQTTARGRILGLDGLRALAITGIVLYHLLPQSVPGGYLGVTLFFTLMGYLSLVRNPGAVRGEAFDFRTYYKKKVLRLYPSLLAVILLSCLALILLYPSYPKRILPEIGSILLGINNWWQISQNSSYFARLANSSPFTHLWFLGLTIQYYLLWPLLLVLLGRIRSRIKRFGLRRVCFWSLLLLAILSMLEAGLLYRPDRDPSRIYYGTDTRAFSFFLGMAAAFLPVRKPRAFLKVYPAAGYVVSSLSFLGLLCLCLTLDGSSAANYRGLMQLASILFAVLMLMVVWMPSSLGRLLELPPLSAIGRASYLIYLVMYPVLFFVNHCSKDSHSPLWPLLSLCVIGLLSALLYLLEQKFLKLFAGERPRRMAGRAVLLALLALCILVGAYQWRLSSRAIAALEADQKQLEENLKKQEALQAQRNANAQKGASKGQSSESNHPSSDSQSKAGSVTAIGDSVMLDASGALAAQIPGIYIDGKISRQVRAADEVVRSLQEKNLLGDTVILHLGTNGSFRQNVGQELIDRLGSDRKIYWVNVYAPSAPWTGQCNATIKALAEANANVSLVDWASYAKGHTDWFYSDGIHLKPDGQKAYAAFLKSACGL